MRYNTVEIPSSRRNNLGWTGVSNGRSPAEPRPGHPGQLAGLPRYSRGRKGEGGAYAGSPAGARGDWREAGGGAADAAAEPGTAPPSLDAAEGEPLRSLGPSLSAWGKEQKICAEGPSLSVAVRKMERGAWV